MPDFYILEGKTVVTTDDSSKWGKVFKGGNRTVCKTKVEEIEISTVFLGLDHQYGEGPPLLFETMVFGGKLDEEQERYSTWDEAEKGHEGMVERVKAAINDIR